MSWVLFFGIIIGPDHVKSYTVTDALTCRRIEMGVALGWRVGIDTAQFGLQPAAWAKCVRKEPTA